MTAPTTGIALHDVEKATKPAETIEKCGYPEPCARPAEGRVRPAWWRRPSRSDLLAVLAYLALALWVTSRGWADVDGRLLGSRPNDQGFNEWMLAYGAHTVRHLENPFFTTLQNAPDGVNLVGNVGMQLPAAVLSPLTLLFGASFSYLFFITANLVGTATAWYALLSRRVVSARPAAFVGGLFCGFAPGMVAHSNGHPHITAQWLVPFICWQVVRLVTGSGSPRRVGLLLGLLVVVQFFVSLEVLFLTALACAMGLGGYLLFAPRRAWRSAPGLLTGLGIAGVLVAVVVAYPLWMQFAGPQHRTGHPGEADRYALSLGSFVSYATKSVAGGPVSAHRLAPNTTEEASFYGWPLVVLVLAVVWWLRREIAVRVLAVTAGICAVLSVGTTWAIGRTRTHVPAPFALVQNLPIFDSLVVSRFALITTAVLGVLLAIAGERLTTGVGSLRHRSGGLPSQRAIAAVALAAALVPLLPTRLSVTHRAPVPHFVTSGAWRDHVAPGRTLVRVPVSSIASLYWASSATVDFAVPEGYFLGPTSPTDPTGRWGVEPRPTARLLDAVARGQRDSAITEADRVQARADVRYWRADAVVLPDQSRRAELTAVLDACFGPGRQVDDVWVWDVRPYSR